MVFSSIIFLFFFLPVVLVLYYTVCAPSVAMRNGLLLLTSLFFYAWGEPKNVLLLIGSCVLNWGIALAISRWRRYGKLLLVLDCAANLGVLFVFKYLGFAVTNLKAVLGDSFLPQVDIALPIGISFFTFQALSYVIDVYRGDAPAQRSLIDLAAYIAMFPQLVAGPIVRYTDVAPQLRSRTHTVQDAALGARRFVLGLGKKVLLANVLYELVTVYQQNGQKTVLLTWMYAAAYMMHVYFDFSGYSDMAIGLGRIMGFRFAENFNYPFISGSLTEFWRRWHISLSTWFREYVYIPLGGNRKGKGRQLLNIAIVWLLTGLWHGANWNFVLWGVYYAILLLLEKTFLLKWLDKAPRFVGHVYTCFCFVMGWVLFAITDLSALGAYVGHMFSGTFADSTTAYLLRCDWLLLVLGVIGCTSLPKRLWEKREQALSPALSDGLRTVWVVVVLLVSMAFLVGDSYNPFLYFRF